MEKFLKKIKLKDPETKNKKKIENLIFLIIVLVITLLIINNIWKEEEKPKENSQNTSVFNKVLADDDEKAPKEELEQKLENILSTIKNVGKVQVFINYAESSNVVPLYDETTTTSSTEEGDSSGGSRNITETEVQKDVVFSEKSGSKEPVTQKTVMPVIQGAIITAEGAGDASVKTNIINAVCSAIGISIDKIQVFQMK